MIDASSIIPPCHNFIMSVVDELQGLAEKLHLLTDLAPLIDESLDPDKGRLGVGLLEIAADYLALLEQSLEALAHRANHEACLS